MSLFPRSPRVIQSAIASDTKSELRNAHTKCVSAAEVKLVQYVLSLATKGIRSFDVSKAAANGRPRRGVQDNVSLHRFLRGELVKMVEPGLTSLTSAST